jgi:DNA-binding PadR family transcriptional regulator
MTDVSEYLPVKSTVFLILMALAEEPRHGYGVMLDVQQRSDGAVNLGTSHLYRHLKRLLEDDLVEEVEAGPHDPDDPRRRYYQLTDLGHTVVKTESERLSRLVRDSKRLGYI